MIHKNKSCRKLQRKTHKMPCCYHLYFKNIDEYILQLRERRNLRTSWSSTDEQWARVEKEKVRSGRKGKIILCSESITIISLSCHVCGWCWVFKLILIHPFRESIAREIGQCEGKDADSHNWSLISTRFADNLWSINTRPGLWFPCWEINVYNRNMPICFVVLATLWKSLLTDRCFWVH